MMPLEKVGEIYRQTSSGGGGDEAGGCIAVVVGMIILFGILSNGCGNTRPDDSELQEISNDAALD